MSGSRFESIDHLPVSAVVLDAAGKIAHVNERWKQSAGDNGLAAPESGIGLDYIAVCERAFGAASKLVRDLRALLSGELRVLTFAYPCHSPTDRGWFILLGLWLGAEQPGGAALLHIDISDLLPAGGAVGRSVSDPTGLGGGTGPNELVLTRDLLAATLEHSLEKVLTSVLARRSERALAAGPGSDDANGSDAYERVHRLLSKRQMQVLRLIGEGKTNLEIAEALSTSPNTVKLHVSAILKRLQLSSRTQAALLAAKLPRGLPP